MIRFILILLVIGLFFVLTPITWLIQWIIGRFDAKRGELCALHMVQTAFRVIEFLTGSSVTVIGKENIPNDTAVLYILNHRSMLDIILTYARCPGLTGYVAKKELEKYPFLSWWMKWLHCLFLDRSNLKEGLKTILTAIEQVKSGISIAIFPEGTRSKTEHETEMLPFHEGSFKIASKTGCPIVPVAITGSVNIFEAHFPKIKPASVIIEYGKPIYPKELSKEDQKFLGRYTQEIIREMLEKNQ